MNKEEIFFNALRDVFVGAKVEGESGYVNLMRIKARYYEKGVFPQLQKDIAEALKPFPEFREELFDRLYTFFRRYFSESGSIYFRYTPLHEKVYEQVYTDERDVVLFWKTHMLYYVKTDLLFRSMETEVDGFRFFFDVSTLKHKRANEKRSLVYEFKERREDGTLVFVVVYSEGGRKTNLNDIRKAIKDALGLSRYTDAVPAEETLERAFRLFERQSEVDYFINKDARKFLREQFDLWLYQYVFEPEQRSGTVWSEKRIRQLQALKDIAYKIIDFIAQFEEELVRIWNKPKFVLNANYVITLDYIAAQDQKLLERILAHPGMTQQVQEWRDLGMVGEDFKLKDVCETDSQGIHLHPRYQHLPLDTRYFKDLELDILGLFDHLDEALDGWLIRSENYQALNTLLPKFRGRVKCVYIDPPYNSKATEILYCNGYKHSSWLCLMENRLTISRCFETVDGSHVVAIDENEQERLGLLLSTVFPDHQRVCVAVVHNKKGIQGSAFSYNHDYAYFCLSPQLKQLREFPVPEDEWEYDNLRKWGKESERHTAKNCFYPILVKGDKIVAFGDVCSDDFHPGGANVPQGAGVIAVYPIDSSGVERKWRYARESIENIRHLLKVYVTDRGEVQILKAKDTRQPKTVWDSPRYIAGDYGTRLLTEMGIFPDEELYPKSIHTVRDTIYILTQSNDYVLDFFAGSGTTAHAVINLNREEGSRRKYILVEMAEHFDTVLLPRVKKAVFSDQWQGGRALEDGKGIRHFVKYYCLEQYEDVLCRAHYADAEPLLVQADPYSQYVFLPDTKLLDNAQTGERVVTVDPEKEELRVDLSKLYENIDLAETLSCVTGKWIRRICPRADDPTRPSEVEFEDGTRVDLTSPPWELVKPLVWW